MKRDPLFYHPAQFTASIYKQSKLLCNRSECCPLKTALEHVCFLT